MKELVHIFWFRRDLRLNDNAGLWQALQSGVRVLPIFIFDKNILDSLEKNDARVAFIHQSIRYLQQQLQAIGSDLAVFYGYPLEIFKRLGEQYQLKMVFANEDYEPYARQRDSQLQDFLHSIGAKLALFKDQVIFEKTEILSNTQSVYTVFTPYSKKWLQKFSDKALEPYETEKFWQNFYKVEQKTNLISLEEMGFQKTSQSFPKAEINELILKNYAEKRNYPFIESTSRLGVHLRFGTISLRELARKAKNLSSSFLNELIWRDFYMMILWNFPYVAQSAFRKEYDAIPWRNNAEEFEKWCEGKTGYPMVDAGMRELNATGFMHNRVRMVTASFLTKHLLIDWRWGEAYFAKKLLDFDLAANNGGWQWASSSGCDAAPYFRIFNPSEQIKKFDPQLIYIKKWIPEINEFSYPKPIVEHSFARQRALDTYKKTLESFK